MGGLSKRGFARQALWMSAGVIVWALHFTAIYGATALACARGVPGVAPLGVALATWVAVALLLAIIARGVRRRGEFEGWLSAALGAFALVAVVWEALPALIIEACA
jgi:hypothetical protein